MYINEKKIIYKSFKLKKIVNASFFVLFIFFLSAQISFAKSVGRFVREGNNLYEKKDYVGAISKYEEALKQSPNSDIINFKLGTAFYKNGDFKNAVEHLQNALLSDKPEIRQKVKYNLGNSYYKSGTSKADTDLESAVDDVDKGVKQYEDVLTKNKKDKDAESNLGIAKKELIKLQERLKKQKQEQKQQNQQTCKNPKAGDKNNSQNQENKTAEQKQSEQKQSQQSQKNNTKEDKKENSSAEQDKNAEKKNQEKLNEANNEKKDNSNYNKQDSKSAVSENPKELNKEEAKTLLENYQHTEEPRGLLNMQRRTNDLPSVKKDW